MKLWQLILKDRDSRFGFGDTFVVTEFIIRSDSELDARNFASAQHEAEGGITWLDETQSECIELLSDGEAGVVLKNMKEL